MKHINRLFPFIALTFFVVASCREEPRLTPNQAASRTGQSARLSAQTLDQLQTLRKGLPAGYEKRLEANAARLAKSHPEYQTAINRVLKVIEPTACEPTAFNTWVNQQLADWNDEILFYAIVTGMLDFPTYDALYFENSSAEQYFGVTGQYSQRTTKTFKDLQRFWDIRSNDIVLVAMHGSMLRDRAKIIRIDKLLHGDSQAAAEYWADLIATLLNVVPQYRQGNHPIFTLNAFAQPAFQLLGYGVIPNKIVMGDGIIEAYNSLGYGDVVSQAVLAHEFGHHVQFQRGLFTDAYSPESTRRTELMADAYSAYYLSHARGASMQWKRVQQFLNVFYNLGDCGFTNYGHHGTPRQRMAAADWGYSLANDAQKQGHILSSQAVATLFEAKLPELIAP
ncbi:hypothetical protein [Spirosoma pollinicola]|uniref:Uncharacterized protein n=1 Tax=Spirosoma pollinicola TaxID=2057025 RepID=A0A2K8YUZ5_9BACT|nr:hypothetical protein [Spirosoma pollinicola]AUD01441.1 hypothetical protein CWM47_06225 [Spirosoma pollinicola]